MLVMLDNYFDVIRQELRKGATQKGHPFRYFTLATVGMERLQKDDAPEGKQQGGPSFF